MNLKNIVIVCVIVTLKMFGLTLHVSADQADVISVSCVSDETGIELKEKNITTNFSAENILDMTKASIEAGKTVYLYFAVVDGRAGEDDIISQRFDAFRETAPIPPKLRGSIPDKLKQTKAYKEQRDAYLKKYSKHFRSVKVEMEQFITDCLGLQQKTQYRFDKQLRENNGKDFKRSDIAGLMALLSPKLGHSGEAYLVFNSDGVDETTWRASRGSPFTSQELRNDVQILTTCDQPIKLFKNHDVEHVTSIEDAFQNIFTSK